MVLLRKTLFLILAILPTVVWAQEREATTRASECIDIFNDVLRQVDVNYVDTLNYEDLTETAINAMTAGCRIPFFRLRSLKFLFIGAHYFTVYCDRSVAISSEY